MLRRVLLLALAALILWRIGALGVSAYYVERAKSGDPEAATKALAWSGRRSEALYTRALTLRNKDPDGARALLVRAYTENPTDARPLVAVARMAQAQGDQALAESLVKAGVGLMPSNSWIHRQAARHWATQGDLDRALRHWSLSMEADPKARGQLLPVLLALAEDPRTGPAFRSFALVPPPWWEMFFSELAKRSLDVEPVRLLYALRRESTQAPVTEAERQTYVARLKREGRISEAYVEWVNGLSRVQRVQLGLLHDGGFELESANWGFDWHLRSSPTALIDRARVYGVDGDKALHLLFSRHERRFSDAYQPLFLDPGSYRLSGRVRTDSLESQGGLKWTLRCLAPDTKDLGESERFLGSNDWRDFAFDFEVPEFCTLQEIRLESAGGRPIEHKIDGGAWFDRLAVRRLPGLAFAVDGKAEP